MPRSSPPHPREATAWVPLGSAQLIDWNYLGRPDSQRGATAWVGRVDGEPVLLRTWSSDSSTSFEFQFLAYDELTGAIVVSTDRSDPSKLRLTASVEVEGRLRYNDTVEFQEHARTGLYGSTVRTVDVAMGDVHPDRVDPPTAADAEIFEYAPESALATPTGFWVIAVLEATRRNLLEGEVEAPPAARAPEPARNRRAPPPSDDMIEPEPEPEPKRPAPATNRRGRTLDPKPPPERRAPAPEPEPEPEPEPMGAHKLIATTNTGESWDVIDPETFVGRSKQCAIVLKSQRVSRKHASITMEDDGFYINDLGAANGIWAGTDKIDRERIEDGAEYIIGDVLMTFNYG